MKQLGVGIIGTGSIADGCHAPAVAAVAQASLAAVLSRDRATGQDFLQRHSAATGVVHTSLQSFTDDPKIQLVIICSPDRLHAQQAAACLKAGKHVLLEKPMTVDVAAARELIALAEARQLTLAIGFHLRSHLGHQALYKRIAEGEIGTLRHIRAIWAFPQQDDSNWRAKDDLAQWWSLGAVGSHCLDLARWFADDRDDWKQFSPVIANNIWNGPHDETAVIAAQLAKGATVEIVSSVQFGPYSRLELFGDKGQAICEDTMGRQGAGTIHINGQPVLFDPISPHITQLQDVITSIQTRTPPPADGAIGLRSVTDLVRANDVT